MPTPEAKVKAKIDLLLKSWNVYYVKPVSNGMGKHGVSDYLCCDRGKFFAIEAKGEDGKVPTVLQQRELEAVRKAGGVTFVITPGNLIDLAAWLARDL